MHFKKVQNFLHCPNRGSGEGVARSDAISKPSLTLSTRKNIRIVCQMKRKYWPLWSTILSILGYKHPIWWLYSYRNHSNHRDLVSNLFWCEPLLRFCLEIIHNYYSLGGPSSWLYLWHSSVKSNKPLAHSTFFAKLDTLEHFDMNLIIGLEIQLRVSKLLRGEGCWDELM